jgi:hypothetical protein
MPMLAAGGIKLRNLHKEVQDRLFGAIAQAAGAIFNLGAVATGVLRLAANVADTETVTIGPDVYEVETVATATGQTTGAGGMLNNVTNPVSIPTTLAALGVAVGDLLAVENEIMKVLRDNGAAGVVLGRGRAGTTIAAHGNAIAINKGNGVTAGRIPVGFIATFTPAVAGPAFAAEINNATHGNERAVVKASTIYPTIKATSLQAGAEVLIEGRTAAVIALATTETLAGANNVWAAAVMANGAVQAVKRWGRQAKVPTATEVALGTLEFVFPFTPTFVNVIVITTATGIAVAWNGARTITAGRVTIDNTGATDWSAAETVTVIAYE